MSRAEYLEGMRPISIESVKEKARTDALLPTMADVAAAMGKKVHYRKLANGKLEPYIPLKTNKGGKITKEGGVMIEAMTPYAKASVARVAGQNGFPGDYGGRGTRMDAHRDGSPARVTDFEHDFCENCDRLNVWCDCEAQP